MSQPAFLKLKHTAIAVKLLALALLAAALPAVGAAQSAPAAKKPKPSAAESAAGARAALVQVELWTQASEGDFPSGGVTTRCPNCGRMHVNSLDEARKDERPALLPGYLVAPDLVIVSDPCVPERFVREWRVRGVTAAGEPFSVSAKFDALALDRSALRLRLNAPPAGAAPLKFRPGKPALALAYAAAGAGWTLSASPFDAARRIFFNAPDADFSAPFLPLPDAAILAAADGRPVTLTFAESVPAAGDAWKLPPDKWRWLSAGGCAKRARELAAALAPALINAEIRLRPNTVRAGEDGDDYSERRAERDLAKPVPALVIGPRRVLLLRALEGALIARFESAVLRLPDGLRVKARFLGSHKDIGAILVEPERDLAAPVRLAAALAASAGTGAGAFNEPRWTAALRTRGDKTFVEVAHVRLRGTGAGWRRMTVCDFGVAEKHGVFVLNAAGEVVAIPAVPRKSDSAGVSYFAAAHFAPLAAADALAPAALAAWSAPNLKPLTDAEARQLAWLGVETQELGSDLAETLGLTDLSGGGRHGLLVTFVHPGSPAAKVGVRDGDALLSVRPDGEERETMLSGGEGWRTRRAAAAFARYDELSASQVENMPPPWNQANSPLNELLKTYGFGHGYRLTYARGGKVLTARLKVARGPAYYLTAPEAKFADAGLQVRELTFETRRFYKIPDGQNALVISRVVPGKPAAIASLKPYELIVAVNGKPVTTAAAFAKTFARGGVLQLQIRRMDKGRVVALDTVPRAGTKGAKGVTGGAKPKP